MTEKTRQLILYLLKNHPGSSITNLMKLAYLTDLISVKRNKKQISNFEYKRHYYGPFDKRIYQYVEGLTEAGIVGAKSDFGITGEEFSVFSINPEKEKEISFDKLESEEIDILDELLGSVRGYGAKLLTEIAYQTKPMKKLGATIGGTEKLGETLDLKI